MHATTFFLAICRGFVVGAALVLVAGCRSGYPAADMDSAGWNDAAAARAARLKELGVPPDSVSSLEAQLLLSEKGRVLVEVLRSHGGWASWKALARVGYTRTTTRFEQVEGSDSEPHSEAKKFDLAMDPVTWSCPCDSRPHPVHFTAIGEWSSQDIAAEYFLVTLPFTLLDPEIKVEYRGMEEDSDSGLLFERMRATFLDRNRSEWFVAYFDRSDYLLKRLLLRGEKGQLVVLVLSEWTELGDLKLPTRRRVYNLPTLYSILDLEKPVAEVVLTDVSWSARDAASTEDA
jgi:hypothetical protein